MGQYYMTLTIDGPKKTVYDRSVDGEYTMAKLTEHSWWLNPFVCAICEKLYNHPMKVAWVGDYAEDFEFFDEVWNKNVQTAGVSYSEFTLDGRYLVNHSKKEYLNCDNFRKECREDDDWCLHPLPLLTAVGNGNGGGDYFGINKRKVGAWCMDEISVEDSIPEGYEECFYRFYE